MSQRGDCEHGHSARVCFGCLSPAERAASRAMWDRMAEDPRFFEAMAGVDREVSEGRIIRTKRKGPEGLDLVMTHAFLWKAVDIIHEDRKRRGQA